MWFIIPLLLLVALVAFLAFVATRPNSFRIERSAGISAPAERIFPLINDLHGFVKWSPFEKLDPNMKKTFTGPPSGVGAKQAWEGNRRAGAGTMEITESTPPSRIGMSLQFTRPFKCKNDVLFTLTPQGNGTQVSWAMSGPSAFINKLFSVLINMDKMVGKDFEGGLANLKRLAENG